MARISEHKMIALLMALALVLTQFILLPASAHGEEISYGESSETIEDFETIEDDDTPDEDAQGSHETAYTLGRSEDDNEGTSGIVTAAYPLGSSDYATLDIKPYEDIGMTDTQLEQLTLTIHAGFLPYYYELTEPTLTGIMAYIPQIETDQDSGKYELGAGIYSYYVRGEADGNTYYSVIQIFIVTDNDVTAGTKEVAIKTGPIGGNLFEPDPTRYPGQGTRGDDTYIPSTALVHSQDVVLCMWPEEILTYFTLDDLDSYLVDPDFQTPFFTASRALHEFTSQDQFISFIHNLSSPNLYVYNLGNSPVYNYEIPILIYTTSNIPDGASLEQAAKIVRENDKPTVWHQAQIHPNEPASGEAALVVAQDMTGDFGDNILEDINVIIIPRINVDGSKIFGRYTAQGFDMNRDHLRLQADELAMVHSTYAMFMPEMAIDGHEYPDFMITAKAIAGSNPDDYLKMNDADDLQIDPATSLNNHAGLTSMGIDAVHGVFDDAFDAGLRPNHYGTTTNNPIGRAYYGLYGSVSILVETRGIGAGTVGMDRRVYGQVLSMKSMYEYAAENSGDLKQTVAEARAEVVEKGKTYNENDTLVLYHGKSGSTLWPYGAVEAIRYDLYGEAYTNDSVLVLEDQKLRTRPRPTAYVLPLGEGWSNTVLRILESQGVEYYTLEPGTIVPLQQYYFEGYTSRSTKVNNVTIYDYTADLHAEKNTAFPNGAIVFPMDQVAGNIIAMSLEPDVNDSFGYDGTFVQSGIIKQNANGDYPIYRYTYDDPRNMITVTTSTGGGNYNTSSSSKGGSSTADNHHGTSAVASTPFGVANDRIPVDQSNVVSQIKDRLASASTADIVVKNASTISSTVLKAMADATNDVNGRVRLLADTTVDSRVVGRLYIDPSASTLAEDIKLGVYPTSDLTNSISAQFGKYFENQLSVVELEHQGSYGMSLGVAVKVNLDDLNTQNLLFYAYDQATNKYYTMTTTYFIDNNGYLHFNTDTGGVILITDQPLTRK